MLSVLSTRVSENFEACTLRIAMHFPCPSQGAFELGCAVCPIAIKYNKTFVDAFWNSRQ